MWVAGILALFTLTPSRLEHYSLPALPAVALLAARAAKGPGMKKQPARKAKPAAGPKARKKSENGAQPNGESKSKANPKPKKAKSPAN